MSDNPFNLNQRSALIPDTKPVDGLGEATVKPCPFGCVHAFLPAVDISPDDGRYVYCTVCGACARREVWQERPIEAALTQRVKVLEEALKEYVDNDECVNTPDTNNGDEYRSGPHDNCRWCRAREALAPPVGEKDKK